MNDNAVVHFEMPYQDAARVSEFYQKAFGWKMNNMGEAFGGYIVSQTTKTDENGMIQTIGAINGGLFPKKSDWPDQYPNIVISVKDIQTAIAEVKKAGGKVLGEPMEIPNTGIYVSFKDTEGNRVALLQPIS